MFPVTRVDVMYPLDPRSTAPGPNEAPWKSSPPFSGSQPVRNAIRRAAAHKSAHNSDVFRTRLRIDHDVSIARDQPFHLCAGAQRRVEFETQNESAGKGSRRGARDTGSKQVGMSPLSTPGLGLMLVALIYLVLIIGPILVALTLFAQYRWWSEVQRKRQTREVSRLSMK